LPWRRSPARPLRRAHFSKQRSRRTTPAMARSSVDSSTPTRTVRRRLAARKTKTLKCRRRHGGEGDANPAHVGPLCAYACLDRGPTQNINRIRALEANRCLPFNEGIYDDVGHVCGYSIDAPLSYLPRVTHRCPNLSNGMYDDACCIGHPRERPQRFRPWSKSVAFDLHAQYIAGHPDNREWL
jgi:hypothetical protein